jgi:small ligand-binding sensory domain FIST
VQIMARDNSLMLESVRAGVAAVNQAISGHAPFLAMYIDCAGRASARSGSALEEADVVRRELASTVPLIGFYSGVEVAPFQGYSLPLDWTGVLAVLRPRT